jgi:hypothetical protein
MRGAVSMKTIVFLDFDDVLAIHPEHTSSKVVEALRSKAVGHDQELWENVFHERGRANLRALYDEFQPVFAISSSWATYLSLSEMREVLTRGGLGFVAGALHDDWRSAVDVGSFRATEISAWLLRNNQAPTSSYVILDDTSSGRTLFGTCLESHAVFCEEWTGFVDNRLEAAQKILREQMPK